MEDALLHVFEFLPNRDLLKCEGVCKAWKKILDTKWKRMTTLNSMELCGKIDSEYWASFLVPIMDKVSERVQNFDFGLPSENRMFWAQIELGAAIVGKLNERCPFLKTFHVRNVMLDQETIDAMANLPASLQVFSMKTCPVDRNTEGALRAALMSLFARCNELEEFTMTGRGNGYGHFKLDEELLSCIPKSVRKLDVSAGRCLRAQDASFIDGRDRLETLYIQRSALTNEALTRVTSTCPSLVELDLSHSQSLTDFSTISVLHSLKVLILGRNRENPTDQQLIAIIQGCRLIEKLSVKDCSGLSEFGLSAIERLPRMHSLNLCCQHSMRNDCLLGIWQACPHIEELIISNCHRIVKTTLERIIEGSRNLTLLHVRGVEDFDTELAYKLKERFPRCELRAKNTKFFDEEVIRNDERRRNA